VDTNDVKRYIKLGKLPAFHLPVSLCGRHKNRGWSFWRIKKSAALKVKFIHHGDNQSGVTPAADAWILKARDKLKMPFEAIGRTMKLSGQTVINRYVRLKKKRFRYAVKNKSAATQPPRRGRKS
jgi:hypothetical protein